MLLGLHAERTANAVRINVEFKSVMNFVAEAYDTCKVPSFVPDPSVSPAELDRLNEELGRWCITNLD